MKYDYPTIARKLNQCWPDFIFNQSNLEACIESETVAAGDFFFQSLKPLNFRVQSLFQVFFVYIILLKTKK